jgi:DnaJ family protein C protein 19
VILLLLAALAASYWAWRKGLLEANVNTALGALAGLAGLWSLARGEWLGGAIMIGVAASWTVLRKARTAQDRSGGSSRGARPPSASTMRLDEAYRVLDLPDDADAKAVKLAHRRLVQKVHPDQGGTADLAARVNTARDTLLAELGRRR